MIPKTIPPWRKMETGGNQISAWSVPVPVMFAILELAGDKRGPWASYIDQALDHPILAMAFWDIAESAGDGRYERAAEAAGELAAAIAGKDVGNPNIVAMSTVDRARIVDHVKTLDGERVIPLTKTKAAEIAGIISERATLTLIGPGPVEYFDGDVEKTLRRGAVEAAAFTEEALGDDTKINLPKRYNRKPDPDPEVLSITHNFTGRVLDVRRTTSPQLSYTLKNGQTLKLRASDFLHNHTITVGKAPKPTLQKAAT